MTGIIEYTEDATGALRPELGIVLGPPRWDDDHLNGIVFTTDKEYDFFAAIAGARSRFSRQNLIPPRGVPRRLSWPARRHFEDFGAQLAGWLHLSEIEQCIRHIAPDEPFFTGFEVDIALEFMRVLVAKLTDPHVRLVFDIESA